MLSGFMFPVENMPIPLQMVGNLIPAKWYYQIVKNIMIKGTGLEVVWKHVLVLFAMMAVLFIIAVKKFKIRLEWQLIIFWAAIWLRRMFIYYYFLADISAFHSRFFAFED